MNKKFIAAVSLLLFLVMFAGCSCGNNVAGEWTMGEYDMTTGEKVKDKVYDDTKSYANEKTDHIFTYEPTAVYSSRIEGGILIDELFHDQSDMYLNSEHTAEDEVTVRFRTARGNVDGVNLLVREYEQVKDYTVVEMSLESSDDYGDYYTATLSPSAANRWYIFEVQKGSAKVYYTAGLVKTFLPTKNDTNWFILTPGYKTPEWAQGTTYYSIFTDSFFNGDPMIDADLGSHTNAVARPWGTSRIGYQYPAIVSTTGADYYGGDLAGIRDKLSYLKNTLGIGTIYTNPITESTFNVGYGHVDYQTISRFYGTNLELAKLTSLMHDNGMRFITDGVWLYSASNSKEMNKTGFWPETGAMQSESSKYMDMFYLNSAWPDFKTVYGPSVYKLNFSTDFTKDYIIRNQNSALLYFMQEPFNIDGWRLDVPAYNENSTNGYEEMKLMREAMKALNPDSILIGETTVLPEELHGTALDSLWNYYNFGGSIYPYFGAQRMIPSDTKVPSGDYNGEKYTETQFLERYASAVNARPFTASKAMFNSLSSHDIFRVMTNLEENVDHVRMAISMQMTFTGSPSIYYGDEIGMTGQSNSFGNMQYFDWNTKNWNYDILNTYRSFASLREDFKEELSQGGFMILNANDTAKTYSYARFINDSAVVMAGNSSDRIQYVEIPVYKLGSLKNGQLVYDYNTGKAYEVRDGKIVVELQPSSYSVIVPENVSGGFNGRYVSLDIGSVPKTGAAWTDGDKITLAGSGFMENVNDNFRFFGENAFGAFSVSVRINGADSVSGAGLTVRETDSTYSRQVSLLVENGKIRLVTRSEEGGDIAVNEPEFSGAANYLRITRDNSGMFVFEISADGLSYQTVGEAYVPMREQVLAGVFVASGEETVTAEFEELTVKNDETLYFDSFEGALSPIYAKLPETRLFETDAESGILSLTSETAASRLLASPNTGDISVSVKIIGSDAKQGLVIYQGENNNVSLYRDGGRLVLRSVLSGLEATEKTAEISSEEIYLHLQKAGLYVSAYYSENGTDWSKLGGFIDANFSEIYAGMEVLGKGTGHFDDFTVGNFIDGKKDFVSNRDMSVNEFKFPEAPYYSIVYGEGEWSYTEGGFRQSSESGYANCDYTSMFVADKYYFDTTVKGEGGKGMAGISFGKKKKSERADKNGYYLAVKSNGNVVLYCDGEVIAENKKTGLDFENSNRIRIVAEAGGYIRVYVNDAPNPVINCETPSDSIAGRMELVTIDAAASFTNTNLKPYVDGFESHSIVGFTGSNGNVKSRYSDYGLSAGENGRIYEDFTLKTRFIISSMTAENSCLGFNIHAQTGEYPEKSGYMVYFADGKAGIMMKGQKLIEVPSGYGASDEIEAEISVTDNLVSVSIDGKELLSYKVDGPGAGAVDYILIHTGATLYDFTVTPR